MKITCAIVAAAWLVLPLGTPNTATAVALAVAEAKSQISEPHPAIAIWSTFASILMVILSAIVSWKTGSLDGLFACAQLDESDATLQSRAAASAAQVGAVTYLASDAAPDAVAANSQRAG